MPAPCAVLFIPSQPFIPFGEENIKALSETEKFKTKSTLLGACERMQLQDAH